MPTSSIPSAPTLVCAALLALAAGSSPVRAQDVTPDVFEPLGALPTKQLKESSGVAVSRQHRGVLWTHNDSGHGPSVYAVDLQGRLLGRLRLTGVVPVDWEDIAVGVCPDSELECLYIADTGDNRLVRRDISLYIVPEPADVHGNQEVEARRVALRYPDGPRDVEALAVRKSGEALLVTKGRSGSVELYRIDADALRGKAAVVDRWTALDIVPQRGIGRLVTGAAIAENDETLAVRTYTQIFFFRLTAFPGAVSLESTCWLGPREPQGEGIDFLDDSTIVLSTEGAKGRSAGLSRVRCPIGEAREQP